VYELIKLSVIIYKCVCVPGWLAADFEEIWYERYYYYYYYYYYYFLLQLGFHPVAAALHQYRHTIQ
jgi:hypothetical protein